MCRLFAGPKVTAYRSRLDRINTEPVEPSPAAHGRRLVVVDDGEVDDDPVRDMVEVLTGFAVPACMAAGRLGTG